MKSIVSYPERGKGGKNSYRGNCSPLLIHDLIDQFRITEISDYMAGSGTVEDVAKQRSIISHCYDLNRGFDLLNDEIKERNMHTFWHPPYGDMIIYSGEQYSAEDVIKKYGFDPRPSDLSRCKDWDDFVNKMNYACLKQYNALEKGGRMYILVGDLKRKGKLYSMICDIAKPGTIENIVIKAQHNCWSDKVSYCSNNFIPIIHEYLLILRKDSPLVYNLKMTINRVLDIRDQVASSWKDVVADVLSSLKGPQSLDSIYREIEGHKKTKDNPHWKEKVRQTLQIHPQLFRSPERGVWQAVA
ncbi:MAG: hypothetical protein PHY15_05225 [Eubacteriales bacterium]|nr:hypothetical protein [Eubacteriales bacterium]